MQFKSSDVDNLFWRQPLVRLCLASQTCIEAAQVCFAINRSGKLKLVASLKRTNSLHIRSI